MASGAEVYTAIDAVDFSPLFQMGLGPIEDAEFDRWHRCAVARMRRAQPKLGAGWAAKFVNEYLKTVCYVGGYGREGLTDCIHPPIDDGLVIGLRRAFADCPDLSADLDSLADMKRMDTYCQYDNLIGVCRRAARLSDRSLMEVELFWD